MFDIRSFYCSVCFINAGFDLNSNWSVMSSVIRLRKFPHSIVNDSFDRYQDLEGGRHSNWGWAKAGEGVMDMQDQKCFRRHAWTSALEPLVLKYLSSGKLNKVLRCFMFQRF